MNEFLRTEEIKLPAVVTWTCISIIVSLLTVAYTWGP